MTKNYEIFNFKEAAEKAVKDAASPLIRCAYCKYWDLFPSSTIEPEYHNCKRHVGVTFGMRECDWCSLFEFREGLR